jgi:hypothetical protein
MSRLLGTLALLAIVAGCGAPPPAVDWRSEAVSVNYPEPFQRLYLREVSLSEAAPIDTRVPAGERYLLDRQIARESVLDALNGLGIFKRVDLLTSQNERPGDDGLVLDLALDDATLVHTGETGSGAFWLWLFTGYPGLCVHDQIYSVYYDARARVSDAKSGETLVAWEPLAGPTTEGYALNFHERTSGFTPYLACWVIPPTSIGIDETEVARRVLPPSLRPTVQNLVRLFNQITFAPVNKVEVLARPCIGIRVDDVSAPVRGGLADVTIHATLAPEAKILWAACGDVRVDFKDRVSANEKPIEIVLSGIPAVPGDKLEIEAGLAGQARPQRLVTLTCNASDELRPERLQPEKPKAKKAGAEKPRSQVQVIPKPKND